MHSEFLSLHYFVGNTHFIFKIVPNKHRTNALKSYYFLKQHLACFLADMINAANIQTHFYSLFHFFIPKEFKIYVD